MSESQPIAEPSDRRQLVHTGLGMVGFQAFGFLAGLVVASGLGAVGQGQFQLLVSTCVFLSMFCKLGLDQGVSYRLPKIQQERPDQVRAVVVYVLASATTLSLVFGLALSAASHPLAHWIFHQPAFASDLELLPVMAPSLVLLLMCGSVLRGLGRSDLRSYSYYWPAGLGFLLLILWFNLGGLDLGKAYGARIGSYLAGAAIGLVLISRLVRGGGGALDVREVRRLHAFSGLLIVVDLFQYLVEKPFVDLLFVSSFGSPSDVGIYSVAARFGSVPGLVQSAFVIVMGPAFARTMARDGGGDAEVYETASRRMAHFTVVLAAALWLLGGALLAEIGPEYESGGLLLRVILVGYVARGVLGVNLPVLLAAGYTRVVFGLSLAAFAVLLIGGLTLAPTLGALGVSVATAAAVATLAFLQWVFCFRLIMRTPPRWLVEVMGFTAVASGVGFLVHLVAGLEGELGSLVDAASFCATYLVLMGLRYRGSP